MKVVLIGDSSALLAHLLWRGKGISTAYRQHCARWESLLWSTGSSTTRCCAASLGEVSVELRGRNCHAARVPKREASAEAKSHDDK